MDKPSIKLDSVRSWLYAEIVDTFEEAIDINKPVLNSAGSFGQSQLDTKQEVTP